MKKEEKEFNKAFFKRLEIVMKRKVDIAINEFLAATTDREKDEVIKKYPFLLDFLK